jgi:acetyl-CoA synthetase
MILPKPEIVESSYVKDYEAVYKESIANPEAFWGKIAKELEWYKPWNRVLEWNYPYARWFVGGQCNIVHNALDRHLKTSVKDKIALIWEGQDGTVRQYTYQQLNDEVCKFANALKSLGLKKGDHVSIYLPRIPEQDIAMLACAKIGLVHSVVFSGFSIEALKNRVIDAQSKVVICTNAYPYKDKVIESKKNVDEAVKECPSVKHVIVVKRLDSPNFNQFQQVSTNFNYHWWNDLVSSQSAECVTEVMESTDPLYILYTSGSTGKPKGVVHGHGGYMVGTYITLKWVFNLEPDDRYFCTADAGWVTGHSYIVYSPLVNGVTTFVYEGTPDYPDPGKWWQLVEKYKITKFYTAPTAVRALMRLGEDWPKKYDLSSLKILGSVGEPINPEAWLWYYKYIGREQCPIMDTWWQTETGMHILTPLPSVPLKPGSCFKPFPGVEADIVDEKGNPVPVNTQGYLVIKKPWPAMLMDVYNNPKKYLETYFENESLTRPVDKQFFYFAGDSAKKDEDGYFWIIGRNDDVIKVSGHRLGSAELESAFVAHPSVAEAAAIGKPHELKGESIKVFVILKQGIQGTDQLKDELKQEVRKLIGPIATPDEIEFVEKLPKTRSGKIMRRVLKAQELGLPIGDTSTLES